MIADLVAEKPNIKILLYTDDPQISISEDSTDFFALGSMLKRMQAHAPAFATLSPRLVSRNSDDTHHADNTLDDVLNNELDETGEPFDEIWFFGLHQANTESFSLIAGLSGPESELNAAEVAAVAQWMTGSAQDGSDAGGVLITGDHANELPPSRAPNLNGPCGDITVGASFLGLGRAIGRCIPRAGLLRDWEGPPTSRPVDSFSTLVGAAQIDRFPQRLVLRNLNSDGDPDPNGQPHPLFFHKPDLFIDVFPDHSHEGSVVIPDALDQSWPTGPNGQTQPHVVAFGRDRRNDRVLNILAAYNGDRAGVGRIVADSTWHHYMNLNLGGFEDPAPMDSVSDRIGQFYANLAVWLAPRRKRIAMANAMSWKLAQYTLRLEPPHNLDSIGETAQSTLLKVASTCEIHELMQVLLPKQPQIVNTALAEINSNGGTQKLFLGSLLDQYHREMKRTETEGESKFTAAENGTSARGVNKLIENAAARTLQEQSNRLYRKLDALNVRPTKTK